MLRRIPGIAILALFIFLVVPASTQGRNTSIVDRTKQFLEAYARGDRQTVVSMAAPDVSVYGSDVAEVFHGTAGLTTILDEDMRLWGRDAHIGGMRDISIVEGGKYTSILFNADFQVGDRPPVPVRFCMVWRRSGREWLLVQSSNSVVTRGQSAEELLKKN